MGKKKKKERDEEELDLDQDQEDSARISAKSRKQKNKKKKKKRQDSEVDLEDEDQDQDEDVDLDEEDEDEEESSGRKSKKSKKKFAGRFNNVQELEEAYAALVDKKLKDTEGDEEDEDEEEGTDEEEGSEKKVSEADLRKAFKNDPVKTMVWLAQNYGKTEAQKIVKDSFSKKEFKSLKTKFILAVKDDFPTMFEENSDLRKLASQIYASKPWLKNQPDGIYQAALQADKQLSKSKGKKKADEDDDEEGDEVDDQNLETSPDRKKKKKSEKLSKKESLIATKLLRGLPKGEALKQYSNRKQEISEEQEEEE